MTKVALVTGATGFIGRRLSARLLDQGWGVHGLCLPGTEAIVADLVLRGLVLHPVTEESAPWQADVAGARPDVVFHLASLFIAEHVAADVEPLVHSNVLFGCLLLDAMSRAGCRRLVNIGTSWQHYEDSEYDPVCLYAATKQAFEDLAEFYVQARGLRMVTLALFDTYGPDDERRKLVPALIDRCSDGGRLDLSPGNQQVDMVYVDDVVAAIGVAARRLLCDVPGSRHESAGSSERFTVASGEPVSLRELVGLLERLTGERLDVAWGARPYRAREVMHPWSGGRRLPSWGPDVTLRQGLRATLLAAGCRTVEGSR